MDKQTRHSLYRWAVRSHLRGALLLGLGFGISALVLAPSYLAAADAISGGMTTLAQQATPLASGFQFLTGPVDRLDTIGGYLSYKIFPDIALAAALYAAIEGAQVVRGSESRGLVELWLGAGATQRQVIRDRSLAFLTAFLAAIACIYALTVAGGAIAKAHLAVTALGQCAVMALVGALAFALALLVSQFTRSARTAAGITAGYVTASFFLANMSDALGILTPLRYISPFYYYTENRTLVEGTAISWAAVAILVAGTLATGTIAWLLYNRRDVGGVVLGRMEESHRASHVLHPGVWRRTLPLNWIAEQRAGLLCWIAGAAVFAGIEASVVPAALRLVNENSGQLKTFLENHHTALTAGQYLSFFMVFDAIIAAAFAVTQASRWAGDFSQHRTDAWLSQPVSIFRLTADRMVTIAALGLILAGAMLVGTWIGALIAGYGVDVAGLGRTLVAVTLLTIAVAGIAAMLVAWLRSGAATAAVAGLLVAMFFVTTIIDLLAWPQWLNRPSVFDAFGSPYLSWPPAGGLAYLAALGIGGTAAAYAAMRYGKRIA